ncbi:hypothetical protein QEN19_004296 [Hanseniaspora menglaensis]
MPSNTRITRQNAKSIYLDIYKKILPNFEQVLTPKEQSTMINKLIQYTNLSQSHSQKMSTKYRSLDKTPIVANLLIQKELSDHENYDLIREQFNETAGLNISPVMARYLKSYLSEKLFGVKMTSSKIVKKKDSLKGKSPHQVAKERFATRAGKSVPEAEKEHIDKWALAKEHNSLMYLFSGSNSQTEFEAKIDDEKYSNDEVRLVQIKEESAENYMIPSLSSKIWADVPLKDVFAVAEVFNFDNELTFLLVNAFLNMKKIFVCKKKLLCALLTIMNKTYYHKLIEYNHNFNILIDYKLFSLFTCTSEDLLKNKEAVFPYFINSVFNDELQELTKEFDTQLINQEDKYIIERDSEKGSQWSADFVESLLNKKKALQK